MSNHDPLLAGTLAALQASRAARGDHDGASAAHAELARVRAAQAKPPAPKPKPTRLRMAPTSGHLADTYASREQARKLREAREARQATATKPNPAPAPQRAATPAATAQRAAMRRAVDSVRRATVERGGVYASTTTATPPRAGRDLIDARNAAINQAMILQAMAERLDGKGTDDATKDAARLNRQAADQFARTKRRATPAEVEESRKWFDRFGHCLPGGAPIREASV